MSESIIDEVARALVGDRMNMTGVSFTIDPNKNERTEARAAIKAMKEPTEAMIQAAILQLNKPDVRTFRAAALAAWAAMIDTALLEKGE
jgi:hypothetical protein